METFCYAHFPPAAACVHIALFSQVSNAAQLRSRLIQASSLPGPDGDLEREAVNFAFIDARLICSLLHLHTAISQAVLAQAHGSLRTRTVHSEVLWALSPNNNITEALKRFGVSDETTTLYVVRISSLGLSNVQERMEAIVSGKLTPLSNSSYTTDWAGVRKTYKLNQDPAVNASGVDVEHQHSVLNEIVISTVAMKSVSA